MDITICKCMIPDVDINGSNKTYLLEFVKEFDHLLLYINIIMYSFRIRLVKLNRILSLFRNFYLECIKNWEHPYIPHFVKKLLTIPGLYKGKYLSN